MKTILKLTAVLVLLVMIGGVVTLQSAIKDARTEQQELSKTGADAGAMAESKDGSRPTGVSDEVLRLREANKDLPKLRNEVRQLRRQADEMAKLRADNERLKNALKPGARQYPPDFVRRGALIDAGQATPEATVQTFFWAMTQGNVSRIKDCMSAEDVAKLAQQSDEKLKEETAMVGKAIPGFRIAEKHDISPGEVEMKIEVMPGVDGDIGMDGAERPVKLKRVGNEWKLEGF
jgi:hypothetical protein